MAAVQIGDKVLVVDPGTGETGRSVVIAFLHIDRNASSEFRAIETKSGSKITITPDHLIFK